MNATAIFVLCLFVGFAAANVLWFGNERRRCAREIVGLEMAAARRRQEANGALRLRRRVAEEATSP